MNVPRPGSNAAWFAAMVFLLAGAAAVARPPVFDPKIGPGDRAQLEREAQPLLDAAESELDAMVPERNGLIFCGCPHCDAGTQDGQLTWLGWKAPRQVQCKFCQTIYPNAQYPEDRTRTVKNPRGQPVTYSFFTDKAGKNYFFSANADYARKSAVARAMLSLAKLAHLTADPAQVRKTIILLDAFAGKYPGWCVMSDRAFSGEGPLDSHPEKPRPYYGGIWSRWFYYGIPVDLLLAYDLVRESPYWRELSSRKGFDVRQRLENDVFRAAVDFVRGYEEYMSNRSPYLYHGLVVAGRVVGEPAWVHDAIDRFRRLVRSQFYFDGMWREGSGSYHRGTFIDLMRVVEVARGYSDPENYAPAAPAARFDDFDLFAEFPFLRKVARATDQLTFPNGHLVPVHDTWALEMRGPGAQQRGFRRSASTFEGELAPPRTTLLNAMEHCVLHRGTGEHQTQARLHFTPGNGHKHQDLLNLILWSHGRELSSDIGYTHTAYRAWTRATAAHNTVVVNETEQETKGDRCDLTLFGVVPGLLQTVEASGPAAYPRITSVYRRQLTLIDVAPEQAYVVDLFRVVGGNQHDWFLHGSADDDQSVTTSLNLAPMEGSLLGPGASFRLPASERETGDAGKRNISYAYFRNLAGGDTDQAWSATFRFKQDSPVQLRTTVLGQPGTTVVTGESPSVRRASENDAKLNDYVRPTLVARRSGRNLTSTFVAIHEPFRDQPAVQHVRQLDTSAAGGPVAVAVALENQIDVLIFSTGDRDETEVTAPGMPPMRFKGRTGFVRLLGGRPIAACLVGGTYLQCGDVKLNSPEIPAGVVRKTMRDASRFGFRVAENLPRDLEGANILVTLPDKTSHGYRIRAVEPSSNGALVLLDDDPGFAIRSDGTVDFLYFPQREMTGPCEYRIQTTNRWSRND